MDNYKLLTPGPLTTSRTVKEKMLFDRCTWDDDYKNITQKIRKQLLEIAEASPENYTAVLMQGSGSFGVEAVLTTVIKAIDHCLIITNGAYGDRMVTMAQRLGIHHSIYRVSCDQLPDMQAVNNILAENQVITHIAMVHCETTTGILNPLADIAALAKAQGKILIIDAMSSFGGIPIKVQKLGIDYLVSSANKCIQGVPGFCFIIAKRASILTCQGYSRSVSLDLYDQWQSMEQDGKWRFTSPTHVVAAFSQALDELFTEGGVTARYQRYQKNNQLLRQKFHELGISSYLSENVQSPIITTFLFPNKDFNFTDFYQYVKDRGFVLYPGKLTAIDTFRIGNIGEIYREDILQLYKIITEYMEMQKV